MPSGEPSSGPDASARKGDLASWWKNFKKGPQRKEEERGELSNHVVSNNRLTQGGAETAEPHGIFGVPLQTSVRYANVAISLNDANGQSYIYGYVPIVVAKCGVFLKEKGKLVSHLPELEKKLIKSWPPRLREYFASAVQKSVSRNYETHSTPLIGTARV
jgi:hypothetical protein